MGLCNVIRSLYPIRKGHKYPPAIRYRLTPEDANMYLDLGEDWDISDFIDNGYSVGIMEDTTNFKQIK